MIQQSYEFCSESTQDYLKKNACSIKSQPDKEITYFEIVSFTIAPPPSLSNLNYRR